MGNLTTDTHIKKILGKTLPSEIKMIAHMSTAYKLKTLTMYIRFL